MKALNSEQDDYIIKNIYCATVEDTIRRCIIEGRFSNEYEMVLEVPFEQYEGVREGLKLTNEYAYIAHALVQGNFTYAQVLSVVEAGNIHNLVKDNEGHIYFVEEQISLSVSLCFAQNMWHGATREVALEEAVSLGLAVTGEPFAKQVIQQHEQQMSALDYIQLEDTLAKKIGENGTKSVLKKMVSKATNKMLFRTATVKGVVPLMSTNVVTALFVTSIMSSVDIVRTIKGHMSPAQLFKNMSKTAASIIGGIAGMLLGGSLAFNIPNVSTTVVSLMFGFIGLLVGSKFAQRVSTRILNLFIKDDALQMLELFEQRLTFFAEQYMLSEEELLQVLDDFNLHYDMPEQLRVMYAQEDRVHYADILIEHELKRLLKQRMYLHVPTNEELYRKIAEIV